ncbi:hypothetical protein PR202_ga05523 [Eleusine coracana subsp. coracana]|uniref:Leucine-rich repeat-containing N-terminal plant-type domain-containing protein n=1 Tax=Eleusine coracana subsp. coracana TaxID=191504 RepID=A0AAV5BSD6_ELECO|nr:hypothetical protein PR202_ga05070 [Eleusine coracana subsp. coracana]GJM89341.1 hypothetical protein PR202_ga05523 [Eleusine coracana subsp. coracana]
MVAGTQSPTATAAAAAILVAVALTSLSPAAANDESKALLAFRNGFEDPRGILDWVPNMVDPCTWVRVECNDDNRVTQLELAGNNFEGPIPPEYGNLTSLVAMDLFNNKLSGPIPSTIGNLKLLVFLRIDHNRLSGPIPAELAALLALAEADFSNNDLCGTIPTGGAFQNFPAKSFDNNPRLIRPGMEGTDADGSSC